jgi:hypothetical protein
MPRGDITMTLAVAPEDAQRAEAALREAGFDIDSAQGGTIEIRRASVGGHSDSGGQEAFHSAASDALAARGIGHSLVASGVVIAGGTHEHNWINVLVDGRPTDLRILAQNDKEADAQLDSIAQEMNIDRDRLNIHPPPGWGGYQ